MKKIKVIFADDHRIVIDGIQRILEREKDIEIMGTASDGLEALALLEKHEVDIAILDIRMPEMDGLEAARRIRKDHPLVSVLILTMFNDYRYINEMREAGVSGYILKERGEDELVNALYAINEGGQYFGQAVKDTFFHAPRSQNQDVKLTPKEEQVLRLIAKGFTTPEIAEQLKNAQSTIDQHRGNILVKTGCRNSLELVRWAIENGYG